MPLSLTIAEIHELSVNEKGPLTLPSPRAEMRGEGIRRSLGKRDQRSNQRTTILGIALLFRSVILIELYQLRKALVSHGGPMIQEIRAQRME